MDVSRMGIGCNDDVTALNAESLPSPLREDSTQMKDIHDLEIIDGPPRYERETQPIHTSSRLVAASHVSPSYPLVATRSGHLAESKLSCDTIAEPNHDYNIPSPCALDEALIHECESFGGSIEDGCAPNERPAEPKSSVSPQTSGRAVGPKLEPSECQTDGSGSLRLATPHPLSKEVHQSVMNSGSDEPVSAERFWSDTGRKLGCEGWRMDSMSHIAWTKAADEHLLHLRDVAQLTVV